MHRFRAKNNTIVGGCSSSTSSHRSNVLPKNKRQLTHPNLAFSLTQTSAQKPHFRHTSSKPQNTGVLASRRHLLHLQHTQGAAPDLVWSLGQPNYAQSR